MSEETEEGERKFTWVDSFESLPTSPDEANISPSCLRTESCPIVLTLLVRPGRRSCGRGREKRQRGGSAQTRPPLVRS